MTTTQSQRRITNCYEGECWQRLGKKLDRLIAEIHREEACESSCCTPVAVIEKPPETTANRRG